jgi:hypothetical protein
MELNGKNVLVTGATGFIGGHLTERLVRTEGATATALSRSADKLTMVLKWATSTCNTEAISELRALGPPPTQIFPSKFMLSKWASSAYGGIDAHLSETKLVSREPFTSIKPEWQDVQMCVSKAMCFELGAPEHEAAPGRSPPFLLSLGDRMRSFRPRECAAGTIYMPDRRSGLSSVEATTCNLSSSRRLSLRPSSFGNAPALFRISRDP